MGFIVRHWKGELPLSVSFWLMFVLLTAAYHCTEPLLLSPFADHPREFIALSIISLVTSTLVIYPWQIVGLLRASDRHYHTYQRSVVRYGVQAAIVISLALTAAHLMGAAQSLVIYREKMEFLAGLGKADYSLELVNQGSYLRLQGPLDIGITGAVKKTLDQNPGVTAVILDSEGGQVYEGRGLALLIDRRELDTYSFRGCSSACTTAFIGGRKRYLAASAKLGFHQYRLDSKAVLQFHKFRDSGMEQKKDLAIFKAKNLKEDFLRRLFETPHDQLWFPDAQTLIDAGVIHGTVDDIKLAPPPKIGTGTEAGTTD